MGPRDCAGAVTKGGTGRVRRVAACRNCGKRGFPVRCSQARVAPSDPRHSPRRTSPGVARGGTRLRRASYWLPDTTPHTKDDISADGARSGTAPSPTRLCCFCAFLPAMACLKDLEGKWRLTESHGFEEYMKELGETLSPNPSLASHPCGVVLVRFHHAVGGAAGSTLRQLGWSARLCRRLRTWWVTPLLSFSASCPRSSPLLLPVLHRCVPAVLL